MFLSPSFFGVAAWNCQYLWIHFAWLASGQQMYRDKVLVLPRFNLFPFTRRNTSPRSPHKVLGCSRLPRAVYCSKYICRSTFWQLVLYGHCSSKRWRNYLQVLKCTLLKHLSLFWKPKVLDRSLSCCEWTEGSFSLDQGYLSHLHHQVCSQASAREDILATSWILVALMLCECWQDEGRHFAVCWVALKRMQNELPKEWGAPWSLAMKCSSVAYSHVAEQLGLKTKIREMKAGVSGKGQFCCHTQCRVWRCDTSVCPSSFPNSAWSSKPLPPSSTVRPCGLNKKLMKPMWNWVGCQGRKQAHIACCVCLTEGSQWAFVNNNTMYH